MPDSGLVQLYPQSILRNSHCRGLHPFPERKKIVIDVARPLLFLFQDSESNSSSYFSIGKRNYQICRLQEIAPDWISVVFTVKLSALISVFKVFLIVNFTWRN